MKVEQFIALRGKGGNGTARISSDEKSTEIELVMRSKSAQPLTAYLVTDRGTVAVPLANNRHGVTRCGSDIRAVLIACDEGGNPSFLLAGTARGAHVNIEEAMRDIRMRSSMRPRADIGKSSACVVPAGPKAANLSFQRRAADSAGRTTEASPSGARRAPVSGSGAKQNVPAKTATEGPVSSASKDTGGRSANAKETATVRSPGKAVEYETLNANSRTAQGGSALKNPSTDNTNQKNVQSPRQSAEAKAVAASSSGPNVSNPAVSRSKNSSISPSGQSAQTQATRPAEPLTEPRRSDNAPNPHTASGAKPTNSGPSDSGCGDNVRHANARTNAPRQAPQPAALHPDQRGSRSQIESAHNECGNRQSGESSILNDILKRADILFHTPVQPSKTGINKRDIPRPAASSGIREEIHVYNPFPDAFPRSVWKRVVYPGTSRYYLEGEVVKDGARYLIHALPGEYGAAMQRGNGFSRFMRSADGTGYWLRIRRI